MFAVNQSDRNNELKKLECLDNHIDCISICLA